MTDPSVTEPVTKRADQLVVGDRIPPHCLPTSFFDETGEVVFIKTYSYRGEDFVFVAYQQAVGYDSTTYVASKDVSVFPADTGLGYSRADDGEQPQPSAGRTPPHFGVVEVAGGLVEIEPSWSSETGFFEPGRVPELVGDDVPNAPQPGEFHCPGRAASGSGSRPVCGFDDWDHDPHDYGKHKAD